MMKVWRLPFLIGLASLVGLLLALFEDGLADWLSVGLLAIPATIGIVLGHLKRRS